MSAKFNQATATSSLDHHLDPRFETQVSVLSLPSLKDTQELQRNGNQWWIGLMHVSLMAPEESATGFVAQKFRRRRCGRYSPGSAHARTKSKTTEIDGLRFKDKDLAVVGTLEYGQFGVVRLPSHLVSAELIGTLVVKIDVVSCRLNNRVYVRKSIEKKFALRTRDQCSPQFERDLLLQALKTDSPWAPHLLCAFQTPTHLNLVMDYAEGGTLWDVLESSPHDGRVLESDLKWWAPQVVSAIHWCHSQGFAHRDIKPHNFVLTPDAHVLLIDFGSTAPLLPPRADGTQFLPKKHCLVPCGTCDYISPEILLAHEEALVALEMDDEDVPGPARPVQTEGYGVETDWWSLGAMLYEMAYGVAPFFANDIRTTYLRIMNHEKSLRFDQTITISHEFQHFLRRLLTNAERRLGRRNVMEITDHPVFVDVDWTTLPNQTAPPHLHLPQFTYTEPKGSADQAPPVPVQRQQEYDDSASLSQGFAFSVFFQQSSSVSPGLSILKPSPGPDLQSSRSWKDNSNSASSFIGFSWGPPIDAFPEEEEEPATSPGVHTTPRPFLRTPLQASQRTPLPDSRFNTLTVPLTWGPGAFSTPGPLHAYNTPMKPYAMSPHATLPRTSTVRRTAPRRNVSDRQAMKQLVDCIGMSARKKVLESGRKPKILGVFGTRSSASGTTGHNTKSTTTKQLRFDRNTAPIPGPDYSVASSTRSRSRSMLLPQPPNFNPLPPNKTHDPNDTSDIYYYSNNSIRPSAQNPDFYTSGSESGSEGGGPPSPSPSPRPGSAMSTTMMSRRSATPTVSGYLSGPGSGRMRSGSGSLLVPLADRSTTVTMTNTTSALLSIPSAGPANLEFRLCQPPAISSLMEKVPPPPSTAMKRNLSSRSFVLGKDSDKHSRTTARSLAPRVVEDDETCPRSQSSQNHGSLVNPGAEFNMTLSPSDILLNELEKRHAAMMRSIEMLEERIDDVSALIGR
ncbi:unnamed protein product [Cyclocybe aegerita]|uniref:Protein kinase domain-containing protein n=1 Tax=Cyclocybe aegerita TaxID=1973307 RepID=A0A8S0Y087_CYCAE|nr:unnamed protein product [Cyclocybe aegerita]